MALAGTHRDGFGAAGGSPFGQNRGNTELHRMLADVQAGGDDFTG